MASDTDALQLFHGLTNVMESHVVRDTCNADAWCHNEADFSAFEFFIELYASKIFLRGNLGGNRVGNPNRSRRSTIAAR